MYVIGLLATAFFCRYSVRKGTLKLSLDQVESLMVYGLIGMLLGARLTYVFVYNPMYYLDHLHETVYVWKGGLSFHGALAGVVLGVYIFARRNHASLLNILDHIALSAPVGLGFGRIGNFINGELWGRVTDAPWGMVFPGGGPLPRHPSQLYQSFTEGIVLGSVLWFIWLKFKPKTGVITCCMGITYGILRFIIEFFREPDSQLGFVLGPFSMGQLLCALMILIGGVWLIYVNNRPDPLQSST